MRRLIQQKPITNTTRTTPTPPPIPIPALAAVVRPSLGSGGSESLLGVGSGVLVGELEGVADEEVSEVEFPAPSIEKIGRQSKFCGG